MSNLKYLERGENPSGTCGATSPAQQGRLSIYRIDLFNFYAVFL